MFQHFSPARAATLLTSTILFSKCDHFIKCGLLQSSDCKTENGKNSCPCSLKITISLQCSIFSGSVSSLSLSLFSTCLSLLILSSSILQFLVIKSRFTVLQCSTFSRFDFSPSYDHILIARKITPL